MSITDYSTVLGEKNYNVDISLNTKWRPDVNYDQSAFLINSEWSPKTWSMCHCD